MKFVIWGAGDRGQRICYHIGAENVVAFIDSDKKKQGKSLYGKQIIDFEQYIKEYPYICLVVSTHEDQVMRILKEKKIKHYFCMSDCPEDFQSGYPRDFLKEALKRDVNYDKCYVVYGDSLYSVLLYRWIMELPLKKDAYLFMGKGCNEIIKRHLKSEWKDHVIDEFNKNVNADEILITINEDRFDIRRDIPLEYMGITRNVLRYSENIKEYHNYKIEKYKNLHAGKRCFVVATGPSLRGEDLDVLARNNEICISMNSIHKIFDQTIWRPNYYVTSDYRQMRDEKEVLDYMEKTKCFIADTYEPFIKEEHAPNILIYHVGILWNMEGFIPFSNDFSQTVYNNGTVTYCAIELAVYLGCKEIYLLGTDASGINGNYQKYGHFYEEKELEAVCLSHQVYVSYMSAKKYADENNIKIYNASRGGELEVFQRVKFDELFRIGEKEVAYVDEVLTGQFSSAATYQMVTRLEKEFAQKFGRKHAVAMVNGTATLHMALEAAGVQAGDEVICPPLTMSSTSIAVLHANAVPVFADVDKETFLITAENIEKVITSKTKAIITVALYGLAPQMSEIMTIAQKYHLTVIEDNAECFGAYQDGKLVGTYGDMASYSFQSSKHLTAGEGGIIITDSDELADKLRRYSGLGYAGISGTKGRITKADIQSPEYERHVILGWNYRMADLCAAVALGQLERMEELVKIRCMAAKYYDKVVESCTWLHPQKVLTGNVHSYWTYVVRLDTERVDWHAFRDKYVEFGGDGIYAAWKLAYQEPMFKNKSFLNREKLGVYDKYDYTKVTCLNAEFLQSRLLQFKTNYYNRDAIEKQSKILEKTIAYFDKR